MALYRFLWLSRDIKKKRSWDLLRTLAQDNNLPWCIIGDFNDILSNNEKRSMTNHPPWRIRGFRQAVVDSHLCDLPMTGYQYTWCRGCSVQGRKEERLDRAMATQGWLDLFPNATLTNLIADRSDHSPILLNLVEKQRNFVRRSFKFENSWLEEEDLEIVVTEGWNGLEGVGVLDKIRNCTMELEKWGRSIRLRFKEAIDDCRKEMELLREREDDVGVQHYNKARDRMSYLLAQEDAYWRQRAKVNWLKDDDTNTKFFMPWQVLEERGTTLSNYKGVMG